MDQEKTRKLKQRKPIFSGTRMKDNKFLLTIIVVFSIVAGVGIASLLASLTQKETYYVLNRDVPARMQISTEQLSPIESGEGQAPPNALSIGDVQAGLIFAQYPLKEGDILSESSVGSLNDISVGVPDSWVVTNFGVPADNAVGGRIQRGSYFDILATNGDGEAHYVLSNVLALETHTSVAGAETADAADSEESITGLGEQYVVGLSHENAAKLHATIDSGHTLRLVISPKQNDYEAPDTAAMEGTFNAFDGNSVPDVGSMTDNTFSPIQRDEEGRPVESDDDDVFYSDDEIQEDNDEDVMDNMNQNQNDNEEQETF